MASSTLFFYYNRIVLVTLLKPGFLPNGIATVVFLSLAVVSNGSEEGKLLYVEFSWSNQPHTSYLTYIVVRYETKEAIVVSINQLGVSVCIRASTYLLSLSARP